MLTEATRRPADEENTIKLTVQPGFPIIFTGSPKITGHHEQQHVHTPMRVTILTESPQGLVYDPISGLCRDREAAVAITTF